MLFRSIITESNASDILEYSMISSIIYPSLRISYWLKMCIRDRVNTTSHPDIEATLAPDAVCTFDAFGRSNTENPLRQNLISISATEDGQPRVDILDGVNAKKMCIRDSWTRVPISRRSMHWRSSLRNCAAN